MIATSTATMTVTADNGAETIETVTLFHVDSPEDLAALLNLTADPPAPLP